MSSLIDDLDSLIGQTPHSNKLCKVFILLSKLDPDDSAKLSDLIDDNSVSGASISRILYKNGYQINDRNVNRHRRRNSGSGCACP